VFFGLPKRVRSVRPLPLIEWKIRKRETHLYHCIRILAARYKKVAEPYEDYIPELKNKISINTIRDNITNALIS
jgi:hypothetical protein